MQGLTPTFSLGQKFVGIMVQGQATGVASSMSWRQRWSAVDHHRNTYENALFLVSWR